MLLPSIHLLPSLHGLVVTPTFHEYVAPCSNLLGKESAIPSIPGSGECLLISLTQSLPTS